MSQIRRYSELRRLHTFEERFAYLKLGGSVGHATFGFDRYLNQNFYRSNAWKRARDQAIVRDNGCDLGISGHEIHTSLLVHHMNPVTRDDIIGKEDWLIDPEYLITTTHETHNAIHYGTDLRYPPVVPERRPGDTKLW